MAILTKEAVSTWPFFDLQDIFQESETLLTEKCPHAFPSSFLFLWKIYYVQQSWNLVKDMTLT